MADAAPGITSHVRLVEARPATRIFAEQMALSDPLEGLESRPVETQVAVLANEVRNQRNSLGDVRGEVVAMKRALYGLIFTLLGGMILFLLTFAVTGH